MRRTVVLLAAVLGAAVGVADAAHTQAGAADALQAPECRAALAALQELEAAALASSATQRAPARRAPPAAAHAGSAAPRPALRTARPAIDPQLAAAQRRAARSCLASRADPPLPGRLAQPPVAVPPVANARPPPTSTAPTLPPTRSPGPTAPVSITSCDAAGCWTSDGARLNRVGPTLWGSRGACSVVGAVVQCP